MYNLKYMKKLGYFTAILLLGITMTLTNCKKRHYDPCDGVECDRGEKCVNGECVPIKKR